MSDWQLSTLRALGIPVRGLAGGARPPASDPLTSPVSPSPGRAPQSDAAQEVPAVPFAAPLPHDVAFGPHQAPAQHAAGVASDPLTASYGPGLPADRPLDGHGDTVYGPGLPPGPEAPAWTFAPPQDGAMGGVPPFAGEAPYVPGGFSGQSMPVAPTAASFEGVHMPLLGGAPQIVDPGMPPVAETEAAAWAAARGEASMTPIADELMRRVRHGDPLARRMGRGMRRAMGARAAREVREQEAAAGILGQVVSSCRRIAVTSVRGGAGKTTVTALVARTVAAHRTDRTLVMDADPSLGSLPLRLGVNAERAYRAASTLPNWEAAQAYLTQAGERLWVAAASSARALSDELDLTDFQTAQGEFSRYFGICLVDCGPGLTSELHQGVLAASDAQILVAPATVDGALSTRSALDWFQRGPHAALLQRTLIVLASHSPHIDGDLNRSRALLAAEGLPVIHLPYDRHLAAGTSVDTSLLAETSQATAVHLATAAFTRATA